MHPQPITLTGRHVRLEPLTLRHAPDLLVAVRADVEIWEWLPVEPPMDPVAMEEYIQTALETQRDGSILAFAQISRASGRAVGNTRYLNISRRDRGLEIGWTWLGKPWQRTGINTEAKYLLLRHAFEDLGAVRVQLKTDLRNVQSQTAIARIGAVREGVLRKHMLVRAGHIRDTVMFSVVDDEWSDVKARLETMLAAYPLPEGAA
jgi:RimJ/RimL family protein N-acetyltransferase